MVAVVAGNGLGLFNTSLNILGSAGVFGLGRLGQSGGRAYVNAATGNLILQGLDETLSARGADLNLLRTYNSRGAFEGDTDLDGNAWRWDGERTVELVSGTLNQSGSSVRRVGGDGSRTTYFFDGTRYVSTDGDGAHDTLEYRPSASTDQRWTWTDGSSRVVERYETTADASKWRLKSESDKSGNRTAYTYDGTGRLTDITDIGSSGASGQRIHLAYEGTRLDRVETFELIVDGERVIDATGGPIKQVEYVYDNGRIGTVKVVLKVTGGGTQYFSTTYTYQSPTSSLVTKIQQSDGYVVDITYDGSNRVDTVTDANSRQKFEYRSSIQTNVVLSAPDGSNAQTWQYFYDARTKQLTRIDSPIVDGGSLTTEFNYEGVADGNGHAGNLRTITQVLPNGSTRTITYVYDERGNRIREYDSLGNTISRTFDAETNQVLTETHYKSADTNVDDGSLPADAMTVRYVYDGQARLRFVVSAEGRVTEYRYYAGGAGAGAGLLERTVNYTADRYTGTGFTETALADWVGGKSQIELTQLAYDLRGNLSKRTAFGSVDGNGAGVMDGGTTITEYIYDGHSRLLKTIAVRNVRAEVTAFTYDGMGRELTRSNASGMQTTSYDDANRRISVRNAAGLTTVSSFDTSGRLASVSRGIDGGATRETKYFYDEQGRLVLTLDPQGGRLFNFYDAAGQLSYQVNAAGEVTGFTYDGAGLLLTQTQYTNRISNTNSWLDNVSAPTKVTKRSLNVDFVADSNVDLLADSGKDRTTTYHYDDAGRQDTITDAEGTVTTTRYDGASRITERQTGDRITRYFYDADGKQVGTVDALGYLTEKKYDAAGRLVETVRYATRSTPPASALGVLPPTQDVLASWRPTNPDGLHSYRYYDAQGRLVGTVDERGFLSQILYIETNHTQQTLYFKSPVTVGSNDTLDTLRAKAGIHASLDTTVYDDQGRVIVSVAIDGSLTRNQYDEAGRLIRQVKAEGSGERGRRIHYNAFDEVIGTLSGEGDAWLSADNTRSIGTALQTRGMRYQYDSLGRQIKAIDANGNKIAYFYDSQNRLTYTVNGHGEITKTVYNAFGEVASTRRYATRLTSAQVDGLEGGSDAGFSAPAVADADQVTSYDFDRRGRLKTTTESADETGFVGTTTNAYDIYGDLTQQVRAITHDRNDKSVTTQFDYDLMGRVRSMTADFGGVDRNGDGVPDGGINATTQTVYDAFGRVIEVTDAAGKTTTTKYLDSGRTIEVSLRADGADRSMRTTYDEFSRTLAVIDARGQTTRYAYSVSDHTVTMTTPEGVTVTTTRTPHGEIQQVVDGNRKTTRYEYDKDGQLKKVIDALGRVTTENFYDNSGRLSETRDARGTLTRLTYDAVNRVIERRVDPKDTSNPNGLDLVTSYQFDALGRRITITEGTGDNQGNNIARRTSFEYDRKGQLSRAIVDPDRRNEAGQIIYTGLKLTTTYLYNGLGNTVRVARGSVANPNQQVTLYEFDALGRRTKEIVAPSSEFGSGGVNDRDLTTEYRYDAAGRITRKIDGGGNSTWFVYNEAGQLRQTINALGEVSESSYDKNGRLIQSRRYANRLSADTLTTLGDVTGLVAPTAAGNDQRTQFVYNNDGRRRFILRAEKGDSWSLTESRYDGNGNVVEARRYDKFLPDSRVSAIEGNGISMEEAVAELATLGYTSDESTLGTIQRTRYIYDAANQLRFTVNSVGDVSETVYDAAGHIVQTVRYAVRPSLGSADFNESDIGTKVNRNNVDNHVSYAAYDAAGRQVYSVQVSEINDAGRAIKHLVTRSEYDALGQITKTTAYATVVTTLSDYKQATLDGKVQANALDRTSAFVYDAAGRQRFSVAADGSLSETVYDALGQITERRRFDFLLDPSVARTVSVLVGARGSRVVGDGVTRGETYTYDRVGRLRTTTDALGKVETNEYDGLGNRTSCTDKAGHVWQYRYDRQGRLISQFAPAVLVQLSGETAPGWRSLLTAFRYDAFGRLVEREEATDTSDARRTTYEYDRLDRQIKVTQPGWYDPSVGKVVSDIGSGAPPAGSFRRTLETTYDALGNAVRTAVRIGAGDTDFQYEYKTYDTLGRVVHDVDALNHVTKFEYTSFGEQKTVTRHGVDIGKPPAGNTLWSAAAVAAKLTGDARARTVKMTYDNLGRKTQVEQPASSRYYASGKTASTNPATVANANGTPVTRYEYNAFGEVHRESIKIDMEGSGGTWRDTWHYFDTMGREIRSVQALDSSRAYHTTRSYDVFGNVSETVEYALFGGTGQSGVFTPPSLPAEHATDRITAFTYDALNRQRTIQRKGLHYSLSTLQEVNGDRFTAKLVASLTYDAMGRVLSRTDALNNVTTNEYNALGQLTRTIEPARILTRAGVIDPFQLIKVSPETTFTLNAFGQIVRQVRTPGQSFGISAAGATLTIEQTYDFVGNLIATKDARGNLRNRQVDYAGRVLKETQQIAMTNGQLELAGANSEVFNAGARGFDSTLERRYAYDALGRQTDVIDFYDETQWDAGVPDGIKRTAKQSGRRTVYNEFGEVTRELKTWGAAGTTMRDLTTAITASYEYDNAGRAIARQAGDGTVAFYYDLAGNLTRQEQRSDRDSMTRVTETAYDALGRATLQRLPTFLGSLDRGGEYAFQALTPFSLQKFDRWGNVVERSEGGHVVNSTGESSLAYATTIAYEYNHDNQVIAEHLPRQIADGNRGLNVTHLLRYDILGRILQELDVAQDVQTGEMIFLRVANDGRAEGRRRQYNEVGQLVAQIDATNRRIEYAYDANGNRIGTRNGFGTVFVDEYDANSNLLSHAVLRLSSGAAYNSFSLNGAPVAVTVNRYKYDQANRRVFSADLTNDNQAKQYVTLTQYDQRNSVRQIVRTAKFGNQPLIGGGFGSINMTTYGYNPLGQKSFEVDGRGGIRSWSYKLADYEVGRLGSVNAGDRSITYTYDEFGQVLREDNNAGSTREYNYHQNGLLAGLTEHQQVSNVFGQPYAMDQTATYLYTPKGQLAQEIANTVQRQGTLQNSWPRSVTTFYDRLGRVVDIRNAGTGAVSRVSYQYDALGNRQGIIGVYDNGDGRGRSELYYAYDAEGRFTIVDGSWDATNRRVRLDSGTRVTYDDIGRRASMEKLERSESNGLVSWDQYLRDINVYDDLNYLTARRQAVVRRNVVEQFGSGPPVRKPDQISPNTVLKEERTTDTSGRVTHSAVLADAEWIGFLDAFNRTAERRTSDSTYDNAGALIGQTIDTANDHAVLQYQRDLAGNITQYRHTLDDKSGKRISVTDFFYTHTMTVQGYQENTIEAVTERPGQPRQQSGLTTNFYDATGRLIVRDKRGQTNEFNVFFYDINGHITQNFGRAGDVQSYLYQGDAEVAAVAAGSTKYANFASGFTPISDAYPASAPGNYVVKTGDTLGEIAQALWGDGSLWYLIADANNVAFGPRDPLPAAEVGRTYRIPNVVASLHGNSKTFKPYNAAEIIGDSTPTPRLPAPEGQCASTGDLLVAVIVTAAQVVVSKVVQAVLTPFVGPFVAAGVGAAVGDVAKQSLEIALTDKEWSDFSGEEIFDEAAKAAVTAGISSGIGAGAKAVEYDGALAGMASAALGTVAAEATEYFVRGDSTFNTSLTDLAVATLAGGADSTFEKLDGKYFKFGSQLQQFGLNALSPDSGWVWDDGSRNWGTLLMQATRAATRVAAGGVSARIAAELLPDNEPKPGRISGPEPFLDAVRQIYPGARFASVYDLQSEAPGTELSPYDDPVTAPEKLRSLYQVTSGDAPDPDIIWRAMQGSMPMPLPNKLVHGLTSEQRTQYILATLPHIVTTDGDGKESIDYSEAGIVADQLILLEGEQEALRTALDAIGSKELTAVFKSALTLDAYSGAGFRSGATEIVDVLPLLGHGYVDGERVARLIDAAGSVSDVTLRAKVFKEGASILKVVDDGSYFGEDRKFELANTESAERKITSSLSRLLTSDAAGVVGRLERDDPGAGALTTVIKNVIQQGNSADLYPSIAVLRAHFADEDVGSNGRKYHKGAQDLGYLVGAVAVAFRDIGEDRNAQYATALLIFNGTTTTGAAAISPFLKPTIGGTVGVGVALGSIAAGKIVEAQLDKYRRRDADLKATLLKVGYPEGFEGDVETVYEAKFNFITNPLR